MTSTELVFTALLVAIVVIAPKVGRMGEAVGSLFERRGPGSSG
jgi:hypothetical protein